CDPHGFDEWCRTRGGGRMRDDHQHDPQGMNDVSPDTLPLDAAMLHGNQTVLDAVYHPLETGLLQAARARGCRVVDGLDMLCAQAARQQELWLGRLPDVGLMRVAALDELAKSQR
ncbi:MAG: shikimate dehydrogenase family protein, partial [Actinomycetota bacterium]